LTIQRHVTVPRARLIASIFSYPMTTCHSVDLVLDTNVFIQLRDVQDLPWSEVVDAGVSDISLIVAPAMIDELDRMKDSPNRRLRDRARLALNLIEAASDAPGQCLELRGLAGVRLRLVLHPGRAGEGAHELLDPSRPDDRLVGVALARSRNGRCIVFSHDTGPRIRAKLIGLQAVKPPASWMLPDQEDEPVKLVRRLRSDLDAAHGSEAQLEGTMVDATGQAVERLSARVPLLPYLPDAIVERMLAAFMAEHPREEDHSLVWPPADLGQPAGPAYFTDYRQFQAGVEEVFADLSTAVARAGRSLRLRYRLRNTGRRTAHRMLMQFEIAADCIAVSNPDTQRRAGIGALKLPDVPRPTGWGNAKLYAPLIDKPRDPTAWYWQDQPGPNDQTGSMICDEFRPQDETILNLVVRPMRGAPYAGSAVLKVSATNLPAPIRQDIPLELAVAQAEWWDAHVLELLPASVRPVLLQAKASGTLVGLSRTPPKPRSLLERLGIAEGDDG
jgi:hypothetical protein